jgi:hypothetical protein
MLNEPLVVSNEGQKKKYSLQRKELVSEDTTKS